MNTMKPILLLLILPLCAMAQPSGYIVTNAAQTNRLWVTNDLRVGRYTNGVMAIAAFDTKLVTNWTTVATERTTLQSNYTLAYHPTIYIQTGQAWTVRVATFSWEEGRKARTHVAVLSSNAVGDVLLRRVSDIDLFRDKYK